MFLLRLILLLLAALLVRRLVRRAFAAPRRPAAPRPGPEPSGRGYRNLTDQDISDADFEEIP